MDGWLEVLRFFLLLGLGYLMLGCLITATHIWRMPQWKWEQECREAAEERKRKTDFLSAVNWTRLKD